MMSYLVDLHTARLLKTLAHSTHAYPTASYYYWLAEACEHYTLVIQDCTHKLVHVTPVMSQHASLHKLNYAHT